MANRNSVTESDKIIRAHTWGFNAHSQYFQSLISPVSVMLKGMGKLSNLRHILYFCS